MADPADLAQEHIEREQANFLAQRKPIGEKACGACHFCGEEVHGVALFCDTDCAQDYEREQTLLARQGR